MVVVVVVAAAVVVVVVAVVVVSFGSVGNIGGNCVVVCVACAQCDVPEICLRGALRGEKRDDVDWGRRVECRGQRAVRIEGG